MKSYPPIRHQRKTKLWFYELGDKKCYVYSEAEDHARRCACKYFGLASCPEGKLVGSIDGCSREVDPEHDGKVVVDHDPPARKR